MSDGSGQVTTAVSFTLRAPWGLEGLRGADTIIVRGTAGPAAPLAPAVRDALRAAAQDGTRIASICVGTFPLAATGLLDGLRATTHWIAADLLAAAHPDVEVDPDVLYVDNGQLLTSAGAAAGLDLCLHMIRRDYGSAVAAHAARLSVMPLEREGGQAQFIVHDYAPTPQGSALEPLPTWLQDNLGSDLTLADIAAEAGTSTRTLMRRFREPTGTTPLQWLHRARPAGSALAGDDAPLRRTRRRPGRFRLTHRLPRPLQEDHRRQPARLPPLLQLAPARHAPRPPATANSSCLVSTSSAPPTAAAVPHCPWKQSVT